MLFVDYTFDLLPNGDILMDPELTKDKINVQEGDCFTVKELPNGRLLLAKSNGVKLFLEKAIEEDPSIVKGYN